MIRYSQGEIGEYFEINNKVYKVVKNLFSKTVRLKRSSFIEYVNECKEVREKND